MSSLSGYFILKRNEKKYHLTNGPTYPSLNKVFLPAKVRQVQGTCISRPTKQQSQLSGVSLNGNILYMQTLTYDKYK